ncbi:MAG: hypothetical protein RBT35_08735 [Bacteroidales bacterium]|jgi:hypothetical protein|nr:hypothetical protein [Bacteroidales bacterium]
MAKKPIAKDEIKLAKELALIRKMVEEIELLRASSVKANNSQETELLEKSSRELREREREIIKKTGESIAAKIKADGESLEVLTIKLKARVDRMGRLPKRLDKISKVILQISDVLDF